MRHLSLVHGELPDLDFRYIEINEKALETLKKLELHEPIGSRKVELKKWCIDTHYSIALLYCGWVSNSIARTDDNSSFWYFLLIVKGMQTRIEFIRKGSSIDAEKHPIQQNEIKISADFVEKCGFTVEQLKGAVCEAIKVFEIGQYRENTEQG